MELFKKDLRQKKTRGTVDLPQDTEIATGSDPKHEGVWVGWYLPLMAVPEWDTKSKGCSVERLVRYPHAAQSSLVQKLGSEQTALKGTDPADRKVTLRSGDVKFLTDVYAHLADYVATKHKGHMDAAVSIVDGFNPAPWISSSHLLRFMQKGVVGDAEAQKAIEEFRVHDATETAYRSAVEKVESTSTLAGLSENETLYSDIRGNHEGEECNSHEVVEKHEVREKPEKTKKSEKHRRGREAGDKENRQAKRHKIDHQESEANTRGHQVQELSTNELK
ncbi:hypothetical protein ColTof3_02648 [Colletotrichum tofieldiae]|nr:hypothetical protein ColTof3_02648 [Colletotrichum tofieldiae]